MPLFRPSVKSPQELVKSLKDAITVLASADPGSKKAGKVLCVIVCCMCLPI